MNYFNNTDDIPEIPVFDNVDEYRIYCNELISYGAIPKDKLISGFLYEGFCRNTNKALWNGEKFEYERYKFGGTFTDIIKHFEDDMYNDVFVPIHIVIDNKMNKHHFKLFTKKDRSSFSYWYYHWKAYNLAAYYLGCWKFKYLFHDIEKPWLRLFLPYKKVQSIHRKNNSHHLEYKRGLDNIDIQAFIIDNECSRFTKLEAQLNARDYLNLLSKKRIIPDEFACKCFNILSNLNL